jgi:hypothetical protein
MLSTKPILLFNSNFSDYLNEYNNWKTNLQKTIDTCEGFDDKDENLFNILLILNGDESTLQEMTKTLKLQWYQLLTSKLIYQTQVDNILELIEECLDITNKTESMNELDLLIYSIFDVNQLTTALSFNFFDDVWFNLHFCDLIYHTIESKEIKKRVNALRKEYLMEYSTVYIPHLWNIALNYLKFYPETQKEVECISNFIDHLEIETESKLMKVSHFCFKNSLSSLVPELEYRFAMKKWKQNEITSAVNHLIKANRFNEIPRILNHLINMNKELNLIFNDLSILFDQQKIEQFSFVSKYSELLNCMKRKENEKCSNLIIQLLQPSFCPMKLWNHILSYSLQFLESKDVLYFNSIQTYFIMECIEDLSLSELNQLTRDDQEILRFAASRNLSKCFFERS